MNNTEASKNIEMSSIKNFGNDRDWDNFEIFYRTKVENFKNNPTSKFSVSDIKEGYTVYLRGSVGTICMSQNELFVYGHAVDYHSTPLESVISEITSIKKSTTWSAYDYMAFHLHTNINKDVSYADCGTDFDFAEGAFRGIKFNRENGVLKSVNFTITRLNMVISECVVDANIINDIIENSSDLQELSEKIAPIYTANQKNTREWSMINTMAVNLLSMHHKETLYGAIESFIDSKGKEHFSTSYEGNAHCFSVCDEYRKGNLDGLSFSAKRDLNKGIEGFEGVEFYRVQQGEKASFIPIENSQIFVGADEIIQMLNEAKNAFALSLRLQEILVFEKVSNKVESVEIKEDEVIEITAENELSLVKDSSANKEVLQFNSLLDYDGEITQNPIVYYTGKGKNLKRVEVASISEIETSGPLQLSLF